MKSKNTIVKKGRSTINIARTRVKNGSLKDGFTKAVLENAARKGIQEAELETIKVMGFNLIAKDGWIVKEFPDNRIVRISRIPKVKETK